MSDDTTIQSRLRALARWHDYRSRERTIMLEAANHIDRLEAEGTSEMTRERLIAGMRAFDLEGAFSIPWVKKKLNITEPR